MAQNWKEILHSAARSVKVQRAERERRKKKREEEEEEGKKPFSNANDVK